MNFEIIELSLSVSKQVEHIVFQYRFVYSNTHKVSLKDNNGKFYLSRIGKWSINLKREWFTRRTLCACCIVSFFSPFEKGAPFLFHFNRFASFSKPVYIWLHYLWFCLTREFFKNDIYRGVCIKWNYTCVIMQYYSCHLILYLYEFGTRRSLL